MQQQQYVVCYATKVDMGTFLKKNSASSFNTAVFLTSHGGAELCTYRADISTFTWLVVDTPLKVG